VSREECLSLWGGGRDARRIAAGDGGATFTKECFRAQLSGCAFLFMEEKSDNSGKEQWENKFNSNVKSVGQECPTHTGYRSVNGEYPFQTEVISIQAVADDTSKRTGEAVDAGQLPRSFGPHSTRASG